MDPKYLVNIGEDRLFFDAGRQPTERDPDADVLNPDVELPIWPVEEELATSSEWDRALALYSMEVRRSAKIRLLGKEQPQDQGSSH